MILIAHLIQIFMQNVSSSIHVKHITLHPFIIIYLTVCLLTYVFCVPTSFCESSVPCLSPLTRRCAFFMAVSQEPKSLTHSTQYTFVEKLSKEVCTFAFNTNALITQN